MIALISPAKKLHESPGPRGLGTTQPKLLKDAETLVGSMRKVSPGQLSKLMSISPALAELNHARFQAFEFPLTQENSTPAVLTFAGDTYVGLDAESLKDGELDYAQEHLAILSGLYGLLRPMDLMQPYRLEMGTSLSSRRGKNLYAFWGSRITDEINALTEGHADRTVINLASNEYIKAVQREHLAGRMVTPVFREMKNGKAKTIGFVAKRSRGMMARHIIQERIEDPEALKDYSEGGYQFQPDLSDATSWVFVR